MIKIENTEVYGWEAAIRGMRNPMNSWEKSDTETTELVRIFGNYKNQTTTLERIGENDMELMKRLVVAGTDHRKFMRMINVTIDVIAPLYWWKEFDTYKVGTVRNSCSTMHKIAEKEFSLSDFSHEHLLDYDEVGWCETATQSTLECVINTLNLYRKKYLYNKDKKYWWQMIQLLPSSYNQRATVQLNYEVLYHIYHARKNHKLDEWRKFCKWAESLPCSELITAGYLSHG